MSPPPDQCSSFTSMDPTFSWAVGIGSPHVVQQVFSLQDCAEVMHFKWRSF